MFALSQDDADVLAYGQRLLMNSFALIVSEMFGVLRQRDNGACHCLSRCRLLPMLARTESCDREADSTGEHYVTLVTKIKSFVEIKSTKCSHRTVHKAPLTYQILQPVVACCQKNSKYFAHFA